jgi:hypothetical protein
MSQREIRITVPALQSIPVRAAGDFIFCQAAARPVTVRLNEQALTMRAGDKRRIERRPNDPQNPAFDIFELDNSASDLPLAVTLIVGVGDFNSQIVSGELIVAPGIATAAGQYLSDSRHGVRLNLSMLNWDALSETEGDIVYEPSGHPSSYTGTKRPIAIVDGSDVWQMLSTAGADVIITDRKTGGFLRAFRPMTALGALFPSSVATHMCFDGRRSVYLLAGPGNATTIYKIDTITGIYSVFATPAAMNLWSCAVADRRLYVAARDSASVGPWVILVFNLTTGLQEATVSTSLTTALFWQSMVYSADMERLCLSPSSGNNVEAFSIDGDGLPVYEGDIGATVYGANYAADLLEEENLIYVGQQTYGWRARRWQSRTTYGEGYAETETFSALVEPEAWRKLAFAVEKVIYQNRVGMAGKVIRAAIELATGKTAPADYLDYVYAISYSDPQANRTRTVTSGGESFAAAGIEDDFIAEIPGAVVLTVRNGLF